MNFRTTRCPIAFAVCTLITAAVSAQTGPLQLDFETALDLAAKSPMLERTTADIRVAEAAVKTAGIWRQNPSVGLEVGPRFHDETSVDFAVEVTQPVRLGNRPAARKRRAQAELDLVRAASHERVNQLQSEVAHAFATALYWNARKKLAAEYDAVASRTVDVANRKETAGEVGAIETTKAALAASRSRADLARAETRLLDAEFEVRRLLGLDPTANITFVGTLDSVATHPIRSAARPDIARASAGIDLAAAELNLAEKDGLPSFRVGVGAAREEGATIVTGIFAVTLPLFWRGQSNRMAAAEQSRAATTAHEVAVRNARLEQQHAAKKVTLLQDAAERFEQNGLSAARRTAKLIEQSYDAGELSLTELLKFRADQIAAEYEYIDLQFAAALARIAQQRVAGATDNP